MLRFIFVLSCIFFLGCDKSGQQDLAPQLEGSWRLISGTIIQGDDTTITDYTRNQRMIKIINKSHFAFLSHDLNNGKDSTASFTAGGGIYILNGDEYTEYLEFCNARDWEGHTFQFTVSFEGNDTLVQQGVEKIEEIGVDRYNIERYARLKEE